jgi:CDP-4-dehydro-6-deoxyglucose reductase, E1
MIKLVNNTISTTEIDALTRWLSTYPRLTMGEKTIEFEEAWSKYFGVRHSVFVNSGSSANLLMMYALKYKYGVKKMAVPALSWSTSVAPLIQLGIEPVLIDCNMDDLSLDLDHLEIILKGIPDIDAVLSINVLGLIPNMHTLERICKSYDVLLVEDNCEGVGSKSGIRCTGTWGLMASHSLYFSHQISTIEGGMITTDDDELYNLLKMLRNHGMARDLCEVDRDKLKEEWGVDDFMELFTFYVPGFNLRPTDLQAFIGLGQLNKLSYMAACRFENFKIYHEIISGKGMWTPKVAWMYTISNLAYPIIVTYDDSSAVPDTRDNIVKRLREHDIETRPIIAGSIASHPFYKKEYGEKYLSNADNVQKNGLYVPNNHELTIPQIREICRVITSYYD